MAKHGPTKEELDKMLKAMKPGESKIFREHDLMIKKGRVPTGLDKNLVVPGPSTPSKKIVGPEVDLSDKKRKRRAKTIME